MSRLQINKMKELQLMIKLAILFAIKPLFPTPHKHFDLHFNICSTAKLNELSKLFSLVNALISKSITSFAFL